MSTPPETNSPRERADEIIEAALALPAEERDAFLDQACGGDGSLRRLVEGFLQAHKKLGSLKERPPTIAVEVPEQGFSDEPSTRGAEADLHERHELLGRYKVLQKLGEGGCGVVYMAEQQEPVKRKVALKVIKLGMDTRQVIARFEAERQALALMDHPNIAKVLDGGTTEAGRPFFVMELVRGIPITRYCDENRLDTRQRLELFIRVCQAVQHAHQKGIIHRDIKPSNILVAENDGVPIPKVIDFGIAKATAGQTLTDKTLFTAFAQFIGTPAYMSPEQARLSGLDIDTRSDIYSLGVLLYELLTGKTPFESKRLLQAGLEEVCRIIREEEPPRPSTKISTLEVDEGKTIAHRRQSEPPKLVGLVRGDLDWIVMKSLEKDRNRRYETANGLGTDIQRFLNDEAVVARPPTKLYRFQKLVRRNKLGFAAAGGMVVALLVGLGIATWQFVEKSKAYQQVKTEGEKSKQVAQLLKDMLEGVGPSKAQGRDATMLREILDKTATRLGTELPGQPRVELELRRVLSRTYLDLGAYSNALQMSQRAVALSESIFGAQSLFVADAVTELGAIQVDLQQLAEAERSHTRALNIRQSQPKPNLADVAQCKQNLGVVFIYAGKAEAAQKYLQEAVEQYRKLSMTRTDNYVRALQALAGALRKLGKLSAAEDAIHEALTLGQELHASDPNLLVTFITLGTIQYAQEKLTEAEHTFKDGVALAEKLNMNQHPYFAAALDNLGVVLQQEGNLIEARSVGERALNLRRTAFGNQSQQVAASLVNQGVLLQCMGKLSEAEGKLQEALNIYRKLPDADPGELISTLDGLGNVQRQLGDLPGAETLHVEELHLARSRKAADPEELASALGSLALTQLASGKGEQAEALARECLGIREKRGAQDWPTLYTRSVLGATLTPQAKYDDAEKLILAGYNGLKERETKLPFDGRNCLKQVGGWILTLYEKWGKPEKVAEWRSKLGTAPSPDSKN